jgi:hypothetical protein
MKRITFITVTFSILIFFECEKKPTIGPVIEFDESLIPGIYYGVIIYEGFDINNDTIPGGAHPQSRSCKFTITNIEKSKYTLFTENSLIQLFFQIDFTTLKTIMPSSIEIKYLENDPNYSQFSLHGAGKSSSGHYPPSNHFMVNESMNRIGFYFTIKKTKPDKIFFITFSGERNY